jgi:hypothetical protein
MNLSAPFREEYGSVEASGWVDFLRSAIMDQPGRPLAAEEGILSSVLQSLMLTSGHQQGGTSVNAKRVYRAIKSHRLLLERHTGSGTVSWTPKMRQVAKVEPCP